MLKRTCGVLIISTTAAVAHAAAPDLVADVRDNYTLLYRHPLNRQIFEQMASPELAYRLGPKQGPITALSDVTMGTQQSISGDQTRYHGWYTADTYIGVRPISGLDVNLNVLALNPSASDGFRGSASVHPGLSLHLYQDLFKVNGRPVRFDIMGPDLGWLTTGNGLLVESTPVEGVQGVARYRHWELKYLMVGRMYWSDDDYENAALSALKGKVQLNLVNWHRRDPPVGTLPIAPGYEYTGVATPEYPPGQALYATMAARLPIGEHFRLATEFGYRIKDSSKVGLLGRADYIVRDKGWYAFHLGYQFRYYQAGFGPRDRVLSPTWQFNSLAQQDAYVTNPFEYFGISQAYDQWSHTLMAETQVRSALGLAVFTNAELWLRYARAGTVPRFTTYTSDGSRAPGRTARVYCEAGIRYYPWAHLPHRATFSVTNKQVNAPIMVTDEVARRFAEGTYWILMGEAYL